MNLTITPNKTATDYLAEKARALPGAFGSLLPELKARAFTVARVHDFEILRRLQEAVTQLPQGGNWKEIRGTIAAEISPFFEETEDGKPSKAARARAELILRTNGFQAYASARYRQQKATAAALPYWQYLTVGDKNVRDAHAALDGKVFPADDPFWETHYPPWDSGCRCVVVAITQGEAEEMQAEDADKDPADRRVLDEEQLAKAREGELSRGLRGTADIRPPSERGGSDAYVWSPASLRPDVAAIRARFDDSGWKDFESTMRAQNVETQDGKEVSVWEWINGKAV